MGENLDTVKLTRVKKCIESIEQHFEKEKLEDIEISFEYIIGSLFPNVLNNIKNEMTKNYIAGFEVGKNSLLGKEFTKIENLQVQTYLEENIRLLDISINNLHNAFRVSENKDEEKKIATLLSFLSTLRNYYIMMRGEI